MIGDTGNSVCHRVSYGVIWCHAQRPFLVVPRKSGREIFFLKRETPYVFDKKSIEKNKRSLWKGGGHLVVTR